MTEQKILLLMSSSFFHVLYKIVIEKTFWLSVQWRGDPHVIPRQVIEP
jgi:hypothetical protein